MMRRAVQTPTSTIASPPPPQRSPPNGRIPKPQMPTTELLLSWWCLLFCYSPNINGITNFFRNKFWASNLYDWASNLYDEKFMLIFSFSFVFCFFVFIVVFMVVSEPQLSGNLELQNCSLSSLLIILFKSVVL